MRALVRKITEPPIRFQMTDVKLFHQIRRPYFTALKGQRVHGRLDHKTAKLCGKGETTGHATTHHAGATGK